MANYTASDIKELREKTGAGMMDVKKALDESDGNMDKAIEAIRIKGLKGATKREGNSTAEGLVNAQVDGNVGVMIEVDTETDFVAKSEPFIDFAEKIKNAAIVSAATTVEEVMSADIDGKSVSDQLTEVASTLGEKIDLRRVARLEAPTVESYLHRTSKDLPPQVGVLVGVDSTDEKAQTAAHDVAVHIAAMNPKYMTEADVPADLVDDERRIARETAVAEGKPEQAIDKIVEGRLTGFYKENVLLDQPFAKDPKQTIGQVLKNADTDIVGFVRFKVGTE